MIQTKAAVPVCRAFRQLFFPSSYPQKVNLISRSVSSASIPDDVLFEDCGNKGVLILNRPNVLNTINSSMYSKIYPQLVEWENKKSLVIVKGAGEKAFAAGADVREVAALISSKRKHFLLNFIRIEYSTNHLISTYRIPYIALIDGITMGAGVGLSCHGKYTVCTEKTVFAMPETQIGFFPDVGGSYLLPRLRKHIGFYLGLTGARLKGYELVQAGIATHYCPREKIRQLEEALLVSNNVENVFDTFCEKPQEVKFSLEPYLEKIDSYFNQPTMEEILKSLENDKSQWAQDTVSTLRKMCPLALKVSLEALRRGSKLSFADCMRMEYRLSYTFTDGDTMVEGVRALLIDKDKKPNWIPPTLEEVTWEMVSKFFDCNPYTGDLQLKSPEERQQIARNTSREKSKM